jgi:hypothetical protein
MYLPSPRVLTSANCGSIDVALRKSEKPYGGYFIQITGKTKFQVNKEDDDFEDDFNE